LPLLIEAWRRVRPGSWRLVIAGPDEGGHQAAIERQIDAAGLPGEITLIGPVEGEKKMKLFSESELFVLPTYSENFGIAIGEALAHSLPVLTTTGAPWSQLGDWQCGWQVHTSVDGLVHGLEVATSCDRATLAEMGRRGRELIASRFQWNDLVRDFTTMYEGCLSSTGTASVRVGV
jgi:glycosyltransferase involved in cell wall biosynthesis